MGLYLWSFLMASLCCFIWVQSLWLQGAKGLMQLVFLNFTEVPLMFEAVG